MSCAPGVQGVVKVLVAGVAVAVLLTELLGAAAQFRGQIGMGVATVAAHDHSC
jgi:hypothetical protein